MGTFQITYDDFTGGHYMGDRVNNQPSNTWKGQDVILTPRGDLVPVAYTTVATITTPIASPNTYGVADMWLIDGVSYTFAQWEKYSPASSAGRMYTQDLDDTTSSLYTYTLSAKPKGRVAYDPTNNCFYYCSGNVYKVTTGGTETTLSSALSATSVDNAVISGYRIFVWSTTDTKLYYSNAARTSFATTDYYEFPGKIRAVYSRTNDILVVTSEGVYSMVGVPGSSITIQRLLDQSDTKDGMERAASVGRSLIFGEGTQGFMDGVLYELSGSSVRSVASLDTTVTIENLNWYEESMIVQHIGNNCVAALLKSGKVYVTNPNNTWSLLTVGSTTNPLEMKTAISQAALFPRNEYFGVATFNTSGTLTIYRVPFHYPVPVKSSLKFSITGNSNSTTNLPTGYATLAEYWHNKPCVVKEVIAEWIVDDKAKTYITGSVGVGATVTPLGCVDVTPANVPNLTTSTASDSVTGSTLSTGYPIRVISRFRIDGANKGYGFTVQMTLNSCRLRRVVVTCED